MPSDRTQLLLILTILSLTTATAEAQAQHRPERATTTPATGVAPSRTRAAATSAEAGAAAAASAPASGSATAAAAPRPPAPPATAPAGARADAAPSPYSLDSVGTETEFDDAEEEDEDESQSEIERRSRWVRQRRDGEVPRQNRAAAPAASRASSPGVAAAIPAAAKAAGKPAHVTTAGPISRPAPTPPPPKTAEPSTPTRTIEEIIRRSEVSVDFYELVDEMLDEIAHQLSKESAKQLSPMAVRMVRVSSNTQPEFARTLESRLIARISRATDIRMMVCVECTAMRSRVENGNWLVSLGASRQEDLQRLAQTIGVKTFLDLGFSANEQGNVLWMEATVFRAVDGGVVWTDAYRSDGTMAALLRTGRRIPSREERAAELEKKLAGRPSYGYMVALGMMSFGYSGPTGDISGANATLRFHERFGDQQASLFGLSAGVFTTANLDLSKALNSALLGAYFSHNLSEPNMNRPELWLYGEAGGIFSGNQGNTFYVESGGDLHLKWRMSLVAGVNYVFPTKYMEHDLGGFGYRIRLAFNW